MLIVILKDKVEIGFENPRGGYSTFMKNPMNITKVILSPREYKIVSIVFNLFSFKFWRINTPGKIVRKRNPMVCLRNGISKRIAKFVRITIETINVNCSLYPNFSLILAP
jgi:2C-methyl-D-erythritol 2,4-cyclodiphosphate synthase